MFWLWLGGFILLMTVIAAWLGRSRIHAWGGEVRTARARELFQLQRERLQEMFFQAAAASGRPRGLSWKACHFEPSWELARERGTRKLLALVPVTIQFEAVEGGDMEGLPAVGNLKNASAVFYYDRGQWQTAGKALFNLNPDEVLERFNGQYERLPHSKRT